MIFGFRRSGLSMSECDAGMLRGNLGKNVGLKKELSKVELRKRNKSQLTSLELQTNNELDEIDYLSADPQNDNSPSRRLNQGKFDMCNFIDLPEGFQTIEKLPQINKGDLQNPYVDYIPEKKRIHNTGTNNINGTLPINQSMEILTPGQLSSLNDSKYGVPIK